MNSMHNLSPLSPLFFAPKESTNKQIILILGKERDLKAVEIHKRLREKYSNRITSQAVHKALLKLVSAGVLKRNNNIYSISEKWVDELKKFISKFK